MSESVNCLVKCNFFVLIPPAPQGDFLYDTTIQRHFIRAPVAERLSIFSVEAMQIPLELFFRNRSEVSFLRNEPAPQETDAVFDMGLLPWTVRVGKVGWNAKV